MKISYIPEQHTQRKIAHSHKYPEVPPDYDWGKSGMAPKMNHCSDEIQRIFRRQSDKKWALRSEAPNDRKERLLSLHSAIVRFRPEIIAALYADLHKPETEASAEIENVLADIDHAVEHIDHWMSAKEIEPSPLLSTATARIMYEPRGVCLLFGPWNFPFQLLFAPMVPIIAAGNTAIAKPNEMAPATSRVSARLIRETFPEEYVGVCEGGVDKARELLDLPVDHIFFTGSPNVGQTVMAAAAKHLASVTLELGGKCPAVVDSSADLDNAAASLVAGRFYNAGQVCLCPDIIWVENSIRDEMLVRIESCIDTQFYSNGELRLDHISRIVDDRNFSRLHNYYNDALDKGATLHKGGRFDDQLRVIHPTMLLEPPNHSLIMHEEIFGPLMVIKGYDDLNEVATYTRTTGKPLALYIFSKGNDAVNVLINNIASGGVSVNGWALHWFEEQLPFGGVNQSGMGRYHGEHGFRELSHERAVLVAS